MTREKAEQILRYRFEANFKEKQYQTRLNRLEKQYDSDGAFSCPESVQEEIKRLRREIEGINRICAEIDREIDRLPLYQKNVIEQFYFQARKWKKISQEQHYSVRQCHNLRKAALDCLTEYFTENISITLYFYQIPEPKKKKPARKYKTNKNIP